MHIASGLHRGGAPCRGRAYPDATWELGIYVSAGFFETAASALAGQMTSHAPAKSDKPARAVEQTPFLRKVKGVYVCRSNENAPDNLVRDCRG